jgi:CRISPR-associated protein Cas1
VIQALCEADIPVTYFSMGGWFYGMTRGHSLKNVFTRIEQFRHAADPELALIHARLFVHGKIRNQRTLLMRNHLDAPKQTLRQMKSAAHAALHAHSIPSLLGIEGAAAQAYFGQFDGMIKHRAESPRKADQDAGQQIQFPFDFKGRNRRPPRDPVNALLSLAYSLLSRDATLAAYSAGFDPYVGFYHQPRFGRPALALDLMEEFRPIIAESVVLTLINNGMLQENDFYRAGQSVTLTPRGRKTFFFAYEKRINSPITHPIFGYQVSYRRALELQFRLLARVLTGEIEQYLPFTIR